MKKNNPSDPDNNIPYIQNNTRIVLSSIFGLIFIASLIAIVNSLLCNDISAEDLKSIGINNILLYSLVGFIFVNIPYHKLGLVLRKIGPLEFEQAITNQHKENSDVFSVLEKRIWQLENPDKSTADKQFAIINLAKNEIATCLYHFFTKYDSWSFTSSRIAGWGIEQGGFGCKEASLAEIRFVLQQMLSADLVKTRMSKGGNVMYKLKSSEALNKFNKHINP